MAETVTLVAQRRQPNGSRVARRLRQAGKIPGVLYGHKEETIVLEVPADELTWAVRHGARVIDLQADGKTEKALIRDIQFDHLGMEILHVDFTRVSADERIQIEVRLEIRGTAPGVTAGGLLEQPLHTIEIECLALNVPESIRVTINTLQIGEALHVRDLKLPEGVVALTDPDAIVVQVEAPIAEPEAEAAVAAEQAEPELIGRQAKEEEEGE
ncbi:MAG: 50S ribosomal protein L25 [Gemmataceae bacterium]|nr:50S ribosomal protein L25 [Gemmataceae bacterium]